jgi:hypothetical protein
MPTAVSRPDIDAFEVVMLREGEGRRQRGFFVSFEYTKDAEGRTLTRLASQAAKGIGVASHAHLVPQENSCKLV